MEAALVYLWGLGWCTQLRSLCTGPSDVHGLTVGVSSYGFCPLGPAHSVGVPLITGCLFWARAYVLHFTPLHLLAHLS